jgi:hypothetical protein
MHPPHQNNPNSSQMEKVMQQMVEAHAKMMRVMTQCMVNGDGKELPPGMQ